MQTARIIGRATATIKHSSMNGWRLLIAQPYDVAGKPDGSPQLVIDALGAGRGDVVVISSDGKAVREMVKAENSPIRWAVIGLVDA